MNAPIHFYWPGKKLHKGIVRYQINAAQKSDIPTIRHAGFGVVFFTEVCSYQIHLGGIFLKVERANDWNITVMRGLDWKVLTLKGWAFFNRKGGSLA